MPPLPWTKVTDVEPNIDCTVMASRLPLESYRDIPRFLRWTLRIRRRLAHTPGLIGYALDAQLLRKTFWTVSAWTGRADLGRFDRSEPHAEAKGAIRPRIRPSTFVMWSSTTAELPVKWSDVRRRIEVAHNAGEREQ